MLFYLMKVHAGSGRGRPEAKEPGDYPREGGFYAVRPAAEVDTAKLRAAIEATEKTLGDGIYESRSPFWGFPDVTHVWEEGGNVHISSHLVVGRRDFGANRRRVEAWLAAC